MTTGIQNPDLRPCSILMCLTHQRRIPLWSVVVECQVHVTASRRSQHGGLSMDMSCQFWHVRVCPQAWRDGPTGALFLSKQESSWKGKPKQHYSRCWSISPWRGGIGWTGLWCEGGCERRQTIGFIPEQPYEVSPFWGSARGLRRWGNVLDIWCSATLDWLSTLSCPARIPESTWDYLVLWLLLGFGWGISRRRIGRSRVRSELSGFFHVLRLGVPFKEKHSYDRAPSPPCSRCLSRVPHGSFTLLL